MFDYTVEKKKTIEEAIQSLEKSLKEDKFGVLWQLDMKDILQTKGFDFDQSYRVLEVCNPEVAHHVLTQNQMVGYVLPCKIVVYDDGGKTKTDMPKPTSLIRLTEDDTLNEFVKAIENRLIACIDKAA